MIKRFLLPGMAAFIISKKSVAQLENNGWLFLSHQQKLSKQWGMHAEVQLRTADEWRYLQNILLRPGISYNVTDNQTATLGYTFFATWQKIDSKTIYEHENRIWEQFSIDSKINRTKLTNRLRLEQRFLENNDEDTFAQRLRYYIRCQLPLIAGAEFKKGLYLAIQNEVFVNVQNKEKVNNNFFDQNRVYGGIGYCFSKSTDAEAGYMYRYQIEESGRLHNHILQITVYTDL